MNKFQETYRNVFHSCGFLSKPGDTVTIYADDCVVSVKVEFTNEGKINYCQRIFSALDSDLRNIYYGLEEMFHEVREAQTEPE